MNVAFIIHARPDVTERVFAEIRNAQPDRLFVIADGPKTEEQAEKCKQARAITEKIDWPCEVHRNYSETNLGCRERVSSGITWVFGQVEDAIILEDDCLPHPSFFIFVQILLEKYRDDERILQIGGVNHIGFKPKDGASYFFARYNHIWGWATWRRAWGLYDARMNAWPEYKKSNALSKVCHCRSEVSYWEQIFDALYERKIDSWAFVWTFTCWKNDGLAVHPSVNLVSNIGFGKEATHTHDLDSPLSAHPVQCLGTIMHPVSIKKSDSADRKIYKHCFAPEPKWKLFIKSLGSRWTYGKIIRKIPVVGVIWSVWRRSVSKENTDAKHTVCF